MLTDELCGKTFLATKSCVFVLSTGTVFLQLYICFEFIYQGAGDLVVYCSRLWPVNDALQG